MKRLKLNRRDYRNLLIYRKKFDRITKELQSAKDMFRSLLAHKQEERRGLFSRIYDLEMKGGKRIKYTPFVRPDDEIRNRVFEARLTKAKDLRQHRLQQQIPSTEQQNGLH